MSRTLVFDIETMWNVGAYFGKRWDVNITKVLQPGYVLGFAWKWVGEKKVHSNYLWDHPLYEMEPQNDIQVVKRWQELVSEADLVVGHNSQAFDMKVMNARALVHNLPPTPPVQQFDTWRAAKRIAKFDSTKLDDLGAYLGYGRKIQTDSNLWYGCMIGDEKAMRAMRRYNVRDVALTEKVYLHLAPHDAAHPNLALLDDRPDACPRCGVSGQLTAQGVRKLKVGTYRQWRCNSCLGWSRSRLGEREGRPERV